MKQHGTRRTMKPFLYRLPMASALSRLTMVTTLFASILGVAFSSPSFAVTMSKKNIYWNGTLVTSADGLAAVDPNSNSLTTFVPIAYVMAVLKTGLSIQSTWDGSNWRLTPPSSQTTASTASAASTGSSTGSPLSPTPATSHPGYKNIWLHGTLVESVPAVVATDPASDKSTTFVPIYYVQQLLRLFGISAQWDGTNWRLSASTGGGGAQSTSIQLKSANVSYGSGSTNVNYLVVNMRDPLVHVEPMLANQHLGDVASLAQLAQSNGAVAAINGTYFNAGTNRQPQGSLEANGQWVHFWGPTVLSIQDTGRLSIDRVHQTILVGLNNSWSWPDLVYAWGLNNFAGTPSEIEVLTPAYGANTNIANGIAVVVENGIVTGVHTGNTPIPKNGFVVEMGLSANNQQIAAAIHVGEAASYRVNVTNFAGNNLDFSHVIDAIGAGPLLVDKGQVALNPQLEGFTDSTLINSVTQRSLVGIDASGNLVLATLHAANLAQEAQIAVHLHLLQAMNLDGGSSTGLYYKGQYVTTPGRLLSNALTVRYGG